MSMRVEINSTNVSTYFQLRNTDGTDATALTITLLDLQYVRSGAAPAAKADATALAAVDSAHSDNTAIEIDATDQPGLYRVDWPDAAFATGVREVILTVKYTGVQTESLRVELATTATDIRSAVGLSSANLDTQLAAIVADTAEIGTAGAGLTAVTTKLPAALVSGRIDASVGAMATGTVTAAAVAADAVTEIAAGVLSSQLTEAYAANGVAPTLTQALLAVHQMLMDFSIAGTSVTVKQLNNSSTAFVVTLDNGVTPTATSRV